MHRIDFVSALDSLLRISCALVSPLSTPHRPATESSFEPTPLQSPVRVKCNRTITEVNQLPCYLITAHIPCRHAVSYAPHRHTSVPPPSSRPPQLPPRPRHATFSSEPPPLMSGHPLSMPQSSIPASLTPGRQRTRSAWDTSINLGLGSPSPPLASPHFPGRMSLYGDFYFSQPPPPPSLAPPPPLPQRPPTQGNPRPPIPPKPTALITPPSQKNPLYPHSIPTSIAPGPSSMSPSDLKSLSPNEDKDFAFALALSAAEANRYDEQLIELDEELAKALEESRLISTSFDEDATISPSSHLMLSAKVTSYPCPPDGDSWLRMSTPTTPQPGPESMLDDPPFWKQPEVPKISSHKNARPTNDTFQPSCTDTRDSQFPPADPTPASSLYSNVVSNLVTKSTSSIPSSPNPSTVHVPHPPTSPSTISSADTPSEPPESTTEHSISSPKVLINSDRSPSTSSLATKSSYALSTALENNVPLAKPANGDKFSSATSKSPKSPASPDMSAEASHLNLEDDEEDADLPSRLNLPLSANQYVDAELLMGICKYGSPVNALCLTWTMKRWDLTVLSFQQFSPP